MLNNDDIMKYKSMIYKIANKHYSKYLSKEDLFQEGCIGVMYAYESYDNNSDTEFNTWVYKCIKWQMLRALRLEIKHDDMDVNICSLNTVVSDEEDTELIDMIPDNSINYCDNVTDRLLYQFYLDEFDRVLEGDDKRLMLYLFASDNPTLLEASKLLDISYEKARTMKYSLRKKLYSSAYIRNQIEAYRYERELKHIDYYNKSQLSNVIALERLYNMYTTKEEGKNNVIDILGI